MSTFDKYRVHEVARDFDTTSKAITEILTQYATTPKNHMQVLEDGELSLVFEYLTQHNQIQDLSEIFAVPEAAKKTPEPAQEQTPAAVQTPEGKSEQAPEAKPAPDSGHQMQKPAANDAAQQVFIRRILENAAAKLQGHNILRQPFLFHM